MTPITPFLRRYSYGLLWGVGAATIVVNLSPETYYDLREWHLADPLAWLGFAESVTPVALVTNLLMPFFFFLIAKELWEALILERGGLFGKKARAPLMLALGGALGASVVWQIAITLFETAEEASEASGWLVPFGSDIMLTFIFGRMLYDRGHPALQMLLVLTAIYEICGLLLSGTFGIGAISASALWLLLPLCAALGGYHFLTRPALKPDATEVEHRRAAHLWPWMGLGLICWIGVAASGMPPALGFLPILPAMPHASRNFGLFAEVEGFLTDPLNRLAHNMMFPLIGVMFLYGFMQGGLDFQAATATTGATLAAYWLGKPLGILIIGAALLASGTKLPLGINRRDLCVVAGLCGIGFTVPALVLASALPGGAMQEAARLGLGLSLLAGPAVVFLARRTDKRV